MAQIQRSWVFEVEDGHASPTRELESKYKALQERLKEETEMRKRQVGMHHVLVCSNRWPSSCLDDIENLKM